MFKVGVTGGIGSGKSTLCRIMQSHGTPVFYADIEAQVILNDDPVVREQIASLFGAKLYVNGQLDRKKLGSIVFSDPGKLESLNAIMRPAIRKRFSLWCSSQKAPYVLMEAAILIEGGGHRMMDHIVVVTAPKAVRLRRAMERDKATREQIEARMAAQMDEPELLRYADSIIVNDDQDRLVAQAKELRLYLDEVSGSH